MFSVRKIDYPQAGKHNLKGIKLPGSDMRKYIQVRKLKNIYEMEKTT